MRPVKLLSVFVAFSFGLASLSQARTLSNSGVEVDYQYEVTFRSLLRVLSPKEAKKKTITEAVELHSEHLYGVFQSAEYVEQFGFPTELTEGFSGTKAPEILGSDVFMKEGDPYLWIRYRAKGKMVVLRPVLKAWLGAAQSGVVSLPLLVDLPAIYLDDFSGYRKASWKKCTDSHYWEPKDFSYFYNRFRCLELGEIPLAEPVEFQIRKSLRPDDREDDRVPLGELQGDNGNGNLVTLYLTLGFDDPQKAGTPPRKTRQDVSFKLYREFARYLTEDQDFTKVESTAELREFLGAESRHLNLLTPVTLTHEEQHRYFSTFVKKQDGKIWVVREALFNATNKVNGSPLRSFPTFWKEAWENGDFIYFGGHSGDGESIRLANMTENLKTIDMSSIRFRKGKTQVAFFDSCSSYAYYQLPYVKENSSGLHLLTYGLVSLFQTSVSSTEFLLGSVLSPPHEAKSWKETLLDIEKSQLQPLLETVYSEPELSRKRNSYVKQGFFPSLLLNVWVPDRARE